MARIAYPFLIVAALMVSAVPAVADDAYRGAIAGKDRPIPVTLTIKPHSYPGDAAGNIRFGEPWACGLDLEFSGTSGKAETYSFKGAGAGACAVFNLGYMQTVAGSGNLQIEMFDKKKTRSEAATLNMVK